MYYIFFVQSTRLYSFSLYSFHNSPLLLRFIITAMFILFAAPYRIWECEALSSQYRRLLNWWGISGFYSGYLWWIPWRTINCFLTKRRDWNRIDWCSIHFKRREEGCSIVTVVFFVFSFFAKNVSGKYTF